MYRTTPYTPGPGDLMGPYTGHPLDPRTPDPDDDDEHAEVLECSITAVREWLEMAETAVFRRDWIAARQRLIEARAALEIFVEDEQQTNQGKEK